MGKYIINGGNKLDGKIKIESAKNAVLPLLAGAILTNDEVVIKDCPKIKDVLSMINILKSLGVSAKFSEQDLIINSSNINSCKVPYELTKELRSSVFMLGALVARLGCAKLSYPGGCEIGLRPIDIHISGLRRLGVNVLDMCGEIICCVEKIKDGEIYLDFPSVGATENLILASVFVNGSVVIRNSAKEPEIVDLINFLISMGAKIEGAGSDTIIVTGVKKLHGTVYKPMPDRIEAGTYLIATAICGGKVELNNVKSENILSLIHKLRNNSCKIKINNDIIYIKSGKGGRAFNIDTRPYPGFPTDLQAQITALATVSEGTSLITENIFEMRFRYARELLKMGADITIREKTAIVKGVKSLTGACVKAEDLRGGAALVLAGLSAEGESVVSDIHHIERGYLYLDKKLSFLGADIKKKN